VAGATPGGIEGLTAAREERIGGLPVSEDPGEDTVIQVVHTAAKGQLVDGGDGEDFGNVERADSLGQAGSKVVLNGVAFGAILRPEIAIGVRQALLPSERHQGL